MMIRYAGRATGRVQGVGFRAFVKQQAVSLRFSGWVKNMPDGSVVMEVQGDKQSFTALENRIKNGNEWIKVESLTWKEMPCLAQEEGFSIQR